MMRRLWRWMMSRESMPFCGAWLLGLAIVSFAIGNYGIGVLSRGIFGIAIGSWRLGA